MAKLLTKMVKKAKRVGQDLTKMLKVRKPSKRLASPAPYLAEKQFTQRTRNTAFTQQPGHVLTFGKKVLPSTIVVMFHGCGDNAVGCATDWADKFADGLKGALVVVPESPEIVFRDEGWDKPMKDCGRDWLRQRGTHDVSDREASVQELQRVTRRRLEDIHAWLDALLQKHRLTNRELICVGFSQGTVLASLAGAQRNVKAVVLCGGVGTEPVHSQSSRRSDGYVGREVWGRWEDLMPRRTLQTKFWALEGTKDTTVPRKCMEALMKPYDCTIRWEKGLEHHQLFYKRYRGMMLKWMQELDN